MTSSNAMSLEEAIQEVRRGSVVVDVSKSERHTAYLRFHGRNRRGRVRLEGKRAVRLALAIQAISQSAECKSPCKRFYRVSGEFSFMLHGPNCPNRPDQD